ncbi:hypothetical protein [Streptomyces lancefieldiae]|uniref:Uncharacterized protein n=1 Tax=Streptomyces lancefieldiae TaxID=3075520 RepID=A0ABU3AGZ9_9ACTN|nr:hypothetical protein [Streptomyces sp. DSM 40712]MDT0608822.1 hypothetical protein [Streptomyces sp. DSM 40712]
MNCPSPKCGSSNVQLLSLYVDGLAPGAPNRTRFARPASEGGGALPALGLFILGIAMLISGAALPGVAAIVAGAGWGYVIYKKVEAADRARAAWENSRICLACTEQWTP